MGLVVGRQPLASEPPCRITDRILIVGKIEIYLIAPRQLSGLVETTKIGDVGDILALADQGVLDRRFIRVTDCHA